MKIRGVITYPHSPSAHHNPYIIQRQICLSLGDSAIWFVSLLCIPFIYLWSFMSRISLMDYLDLCILHGRDGEGTVLYVFYPLGGQRGEIFMLSALCLFVLCIYLNLLIWI